MVVDRTLPNLATTFAWMLPALTQCATPHPIALDDVVRAAAGVYRDPPSPTPRGGTMSWSEIRLIARATSEGPSAPLSPSA